MRRERPEPGSPTQLAAARAGVVTPEMAYAAARENANLEGFAASLSEPGLERVRDRLMPLLERSCASTSRPAAAEAFGRVGKPDAAQRDVLARLAPHEEAFASGTQVRIGMEVVVHNRAPEELK